MSREYVNKLRYLSYSTIYSARGTVNNDLSSRACFANVLNRGENLNEEHYEIYLICDPQYALNKHQSNLCFLTLKELKKHIYLARRLFPFKYSVEDIRYDGYAAFKVSIDLNACHFYHRYLLTWIRYAYEFPFNVILNDALRMKRAYLNKESIPNLFVLCANSYYSGIEIYNTGHAISRIDSKFLKEPVLKDKIHNIGLRNDRRSCVNDLYDRATCSIEAIKNNNSCYLEYWTNSEDFEDRAKVYLKNYKKLKQSKD